jgi:predicted protein tyrosine phosphatase
MTPAPAQKRFVVRSARNAEFFHSERPWAAIQISSRDDFPVLDAENRVGLLRLIFEDTEEPDKPASFTAALAAEILAFVGQMWGQVEVFLIHCEAGLSRSPAVAAALCQIYYQHDGGWFESIFPNRLVYRLLVETHASRQAEKGGGIGR